MSDESKFLYLPGKNLQELFRDKATGKPLAEGEVKFWKDDARSEPKPVFKRTGDPITPFVALENPLPLGIAGSPVDENGDDIAFFYYPYDADGNVELYYIEVFNSDGVEQFTRQEWPQEINTDTVDNFSFVDNYIPNGQFITHLDAGELDAELTNIALGNWVYILSSNFNSVNTITFERYGSYVTNPEANPEYAVRVTCTNPNPTEARKDLAVIFKDVNFLAGQTTTFQMSALTNNGVPLNLELLLEKVYGMGGSDTEEISVTTFTIQPDEAAKYLFSFTVPDNDGKSNAAKSELRLILRAGTNIAFDYTATNFQWVLGQFDSLTFPPTSPNQEIMQAVAGSIVPPATDGSDEGSALVLDYDDDTPASSLNPLMAVRFAPLLPSGFIGMHGGSTAPDGWVFCNGASYDLVGTNSIPQYQRLFNAIGTNHGRGSNSFFVSKPATAQVDYKCVSLNSATAPDPHASGFSVVINTVGTATVRQIVRVTCNAASAINAGTYFEIFAPSGKSTIYWFSIDGLGNDPSSLFTTSLVKEIELLSSDTADQVADKLIANFATQVRVPDFRSMSPKGWTDTRDDIWTDPDKSSRIYPESISLSGTTTTWGGGSTSHTYTASGLTTNYQVTATIASSTNSVRIMAAVAGADQITVYFSADPGANTSVNWRGTDFSSNVVGNVVGSMQLDSYQDHEHAPADNGSYAMANGATSDGGGSAHLTIVDLQSTTGFTASGQGFRASTESRSKNIYVPFIIKL